MEYIGLSESEILEMLRMKNDTDIEWVHNGNDDFQEVTDEMHELYLIKNKNYGDSFSRQFKEYGLTSVCIRLEDKLNRLKSLNNQVEANIDDESIYDTLIDMANYSVLALIELGKGEEYEG